MSPTTVATQFHHAIALDAHSRAALLQPNQSLDFALSNSTAHGLPSITVSPLQGQYLAIQCQLINAKRVLEIGTLGGYSTLWFASTGAHVTSIEINPKHRDVALENLKGYEGQVEVILGAALDVLPRLADEGQTFDFVFVDAAWGEQWECFEWAVKLTRKGGCVYVDNVVREMLYSGVHERGDAVESLVTKVGRDERVTATVVPTVGAHKNPEEGFDGFLIAVVKG